MVVYPSYGSYLRTANKYGRLAVPAGLAYNSLRSTQMDQRFTTRGPTYTHTGAWKRPKKKQARNSFKDKVLKTMPAKHYTYETAFNTVHNIGYGSVPTQGIVQGDGNTQRDGDRITIMALKFNITSHSDTAAAGYTYRVIVGWTGEEYTAAGIANGFIATNVVGAPQITDVFLPNTATVSQTNGIVNPKAFTVLYDRLYDVNSQVTGAKDAASFGDTVQIDQDYSYQASGSIQGKTKNLVIFVLATVNNGVNGTTVTGDTAIAVDLIFKP